MKDAPSIAADLAGKRPAVLRRIGHRMDQGRHHRRNRHHDAVRGLVERDALGRLQLTPEGRAALDALLQPR
jgi:hypothetical protein